MFQSPAMIQAVSGSGANSCWISTNPVWPDADKRRITRKVFESVLSKALAQSKLTRKEILRQSTYS